MKALNFLSLLAIAVIDFMVVVAFGLPWAVPIVIAFGVLGWWSWTEEDRAAVSHADRLQMEQRAEAELYPQRYVNAPATGKSPRA